MKTNKFWSIMMMLVLVFSVTLILPSCSNDDEVSEEEPTFKTTGKARRIGNVDVKWVQLWENGPKFAEYNIGAANNKTEDYGCYYTWGGSIDMSDEDDNTGTEVLSGNNDTATKLWGSNWRMPTQAEFQALLNNCDSDWITVNGVKGRKYTGKGNYSSNYIFLPAAGGCSHGDLPTQNEEGLYWSSTPNMRHSAWPLGFRPDEQYVDDDLNRSRACSVRAVLAE